MRTYLGHNLEIEVRNGQKIFIRFLEIYSDPMRLSWCVGVVNTRLLGTGVSGTSLRI